MATARSPSPNLSRAKTPDGTRKSTKPPSISIDPHRRNSSSKENHSSGRASKNFMAPTISAASKKKILRERNDEVSDSLETSNYTIKSRNSVVVPSFSSPSPADAGAAPSSAPPYDPKTNYLSPRPRFLHYRPNPRIENYVRTTEGEFLSGAGDGRRLEASFSSESDEENKDSEDELSATPSVPSEVEEEAASGHRETPAVPSRPLLLPRRSKLVPLLLVVAVACVLVPLSDSPVISSSMPNDQSLTRLLYSPPSGMYEDWRLGEYRAIAGARLHDLASRFKRWTSDSVAYFSTPPSCAGKDGPSGMYEDWRHGEYRAIAGAKLHDLASRFKRWTSDSVAYFSTAASSAGEIGMVGLVNVTSPAEDDAIGSDFIYKHETRTEHEFEVLEVASEREEKQMDVSGEIIETDDTKLRGSDFIYKHEIRTEQGTEHELEVLEAASEGEEKEMDVFIDDTKHEAESEATEMEVSGALNEVAEFGTELVPEEVVSRAIEMESEALDEGTDVSEENTATENLEHEAENVDMEVYKNENAAEFRAEGFETEVPENGAANIEEDQISNAFESSAAFLLLVVAVAAFIYSKQKKSPTAAKETHTSAPTKGEGSPLQLQHLRGNGDLVGDSGYSVASSGLDNTFSCGQQHRTRRGEEDDDSLSHRRRSRRDSTESSSVSYGSFTTYERLSAKKGYKDDEVVVTPVRRSSRLRSHVTSS